MSSSLARGVLVGALLGWLVGALECAALALLLEPAMLHPLAESAIVAARYAALGALAGVAVALAHRVFAHRFLARREKSSGAAAGVPGGRLAAGSGFLLVFVVGGDWLHEEWLAGAPFHSPASLGATLALVAVGLAAAWGLAVLARRPSRFFAGVAIGVALAHTVVVQASAEAESGAPGPRGAPLPGAPNIVMIVVDTLRADHVSCYGYERPTTPEIDALASRGARFEAAYAQAPWTRASVASLLTSLYPVGHRTNSLWARIPDGIVTLPEALRERGYRTAAFSANRNVSAVFGFDQGFEDFWVFRASELERFTAIGRLESFVRRQVGVGRRHSGLEGSEAVAVNERIREWLDALPAEAAEPFFLYVQYIDPHGPYAPPEDLLNEEPLRYADVVEDLESVHAPPPFPFGEWPEQRPAALEAMLGLYDAEIRYCDRSVGALLDDLEGRGLLEGAFVVVTSDHGEEFFEHRHFGHGQSMFEELLRVPLVVAGPGIEPAVVDEPVELIDLYPTLLRWAGEGGAGVGGEFHGRDLAALLGEGEREPTARWDLAAAEKISTSPLLSLRVGDEKLVSVQHEGERVWMLFDLASDPGEEVDLAAERPERVAALRRLLLERVASTESQGAAAEEPADVAGEDERALEALGYTDR